MGRNCRNDSHFGRLDDLEAGAAMQLTDVYGEVYDYEVCHIQIIAPDGVAAPVRRGTQPDAVHYGRQKTAVGEMQADKQAGIINQKTV